MIALLLEPQDLLFCRDGRPIVAGEGAAAGTALPNPQVLAGALRTHLLKKRGQLIDGKANEQAIARVMQVHLRGPLLWQDDYPLLPFPADCVCATKPKHGQGEDHSEPYRLLLPLNSELPGWRAPADFPNLRPMWASQPTVRDNSDTSRLRAWHPRTGYLSWKGFQAWAAGKAPQGSDHVDVAKLFVTEARTQVGLNVTEATAEEGRLFTTRYLRFQAGVRFYCEVEGADELGQESFTLHLGGDRRLVHASPIDPVKWPLASGLRTCALAITPTILPASGALAPNDWQASLRGAVVPGTEAISGWDLAAGHGQGAPRPTRFALRPGAVWHTEGLSSWPKQIGSETETGFGWLAWGQRGNIQ